MPRTEYYDDPDALEPNTLVVAASVVVTDDGGRTRMAGWWAWRGVADGLQARQNDAHVRRVRTPKEDRETNSESVWEAVPWLSGKLDPTLFYNN